jgi:uncharacterized protein HemX
VNQVILKILPGFLVVAILLGAGYYCGLKVKQVEVDKLESQLKDYQHLGERIEVLRADIQKDMENKNKDLVDAYKADVEKIRQEFDSARKAVSSIPG